jgi:phosphate transport system protein
MNQDRRHVAHELEELKARLLAMGGLAEDRLRRAMRGLVDRNHQLLADVIAGDSRIDDLQMEIDNRCFILIALHQPVALDLRTLVSAPRISADLERVGDLAVNICEVAQRYLLHPPVKPLIDLPRMGDLALKMLREALDAFLSADVSLAKTVLSQDDPQTIEPGVDLILMSRHLERVGDHATSIAEDVIFIVEARDVRHRSTRAIATTNQAGGTTIERRKNSRVSPV